MAKKTPRLKPGPPKTTGPLPIRCVRVSDEMWDRWQEYCADNGTQVGTLIKQVMERRITSAAKRALKK